MSGRDLSHRRPLRLSPALCLALAMTLAGCEDDLCVDESKAFAECAGGSWDLSQEMDAAAACSSGDQDSDAYHHCMIACAEGGTCEGWFCYTRCLCYTPDSCDFE